VTSALGKTWKFLNTPLHGWQRAVFLPLAGLLGIVLALLGNHYSPGLAGLACGAMGLYFYRQRRRRRRRETQKEGNYYSDDDYRDLRS
jgi:hypothetical protein